MSRIKETKQEKIIKEVKQEFETKNIENNLVDIVTQADEIVAKHKQIIVLVAQVLEKHKKLHDEVLAQKLYNFFEKNLEE